MIMVMQMKFVCLCVPSALSAVWLYLVVSSSFPPSPFSLALVV